VLSLAAGDARTRAVIPSTRVLRRPIYLAASLTE
jgi:hypothetical protein